MATGEEARQYYVLNKIDDGAFEELQSLSIAENQFTDKLGKEIVLSSGQTQLTYKIATLKVIGDVIHSSIEVSAF